MQTSHSPSEQAGRSAWRFFPWVMAGALLLVIAANAAMITTAVSGFPGRVGRNGFDLSNQYNSVLARADRAAELGWQLQAAVRQGRPVLVLRDRAGQVLAGARIEVEAQRPVGARQRLMLTFHASEDGSLIADAPLPVGGQWDLLVTVQAGGVEMTATRRLFVP